MLSVTDRKLVSTDFHHAVDKTALRQGNLLRVLHSRTTNGLLLPHAEPGRYHSRPRPL